MTPRQVYYLTKTEAEANMCITTSPLSINCTGLEYYYAPFKYKTYRRDYSLVYVLSGEIDFSLENIDISLSEGYFMIFPPNVESTFGTKNNFLEYYWLQFSGSMAQQLLKGVSAELKTPYYIGRCDDVCTKFDGIFKEFLINDKFFSSNCAAKLTELFTCLFRKLPHAKKELLSSVSYIRKHYNEPISVKTLASMEYVSHSYYRARFKQTMGCSPKEYISDQRINAACFYLTNTDYPIGNIAALTGFGDQLYFSRFFKRKTGLSPVEYRKSKS